MNFIVGIYEVGELENIIKKVDNIKFSKYESNTSKIINSIEKFIELS